MRTPSLYSQDDPISEALRPPVTETEAERIARLSAEADAKRISDKIDEDLREERERLRRKKGDVKVCSLSTILALLCAYTHFPCSSYS
jgi:guanine nucleotide-binding protein subunit alpha